jgi:hypothetical protein
MAHLGRGTHYGGVPFLEMPIVQSMHCLDCGDDSHPRLRRPSSLRTEATLWIAAVVIGLSAGAWQALTSAPAGTPPAMMSGLSIAAPETNEPAAAVHSHTRDAPRNAVLAIGDWLVRRVFGFLKVAWWAIPIPLAFSVWRQRTRRPICAHCGSRRLIPAEPVYPGLTG